MIGGMIWPPVDATLSIAAACSGRNPVFFMVGMVALPVSTTFATAAPVTVPTNPEPITAGNAAPPRTRLPTYLPSSRNSGSTPVWRNSGAEDHEQEMTSADTLMIGPNMPSVRLAPM